MLGTRLGGCPLLVSLDEDTSKSTHPWCPNPAVLGPSGLRAASLYQDATLKVFGGSYAMVAGSTNNPSAVLATGNGHVVFDPGSNVVINGASNYFIQGYLAHP
jgi:hypothetical protein